jgi:signal transduction histidine kinase
VNEAIVKMFNFDNVEQMLAAGSISLWKEPKQREPLMAKLQKQGIVTNFETETITHDNQSLYVLFSTKLHGDNISGMVMNITEQKQAELKVLEYQKRLKNLANQLTITEEKVRKQIAVDLHDNVGQMLASIRMQMSRVTDLEENPELTIRMKNISQALLKSIQATREAIFDLSPPQLNEIGIYAAVEDWMKEQIEEKYNIRTSITGEQEKFNLDENTQFLVFRSIKELMINVVKHAGAKQLWVKFKINKKFLEITVQDDGIGFVYDPDLHKVKENVYGLFSIQERMFDLGGSITIDSGLDKGTQAKLTIPLVAN